MGVTATQVRLTAEQRRKIEEIAGPQKMAQFIREAVEEKIKREG